MTETEFETRRSELVGVIGDVWKISLRPSFSLLVLLRRGCSTCLRETHAGVIIIVYDLIAFKGNKNDMS